MTYDDFTEDIRAQRERQINHEIDVRLHEMRGYSSLQRIEADGRAYVLAARAMWRRSTEPVVTADTAAHLTRWFAR